MNWDPSQVEEPTDATAAASARADLRRKTVTGLSWSLGAQVSKTFVTFLLGIVLARLLTPGEFGLLGMVTVISSFAAVLGRFGAEQALIHEPNLNKIQISTLFWLSLGIGITLTLLFIASARLIADFYSEIALVDITRLLSITFVVNSFLPIYSALLKRDLEFKSISLAEFFGIISSGVVAVSLALSGYGVWSLVAQALIAPSVVVIVLAYQSRWFPSLVFSWSSASLLISYGCRVLGSNSLNYWSRNLDRLLIGKVIGPASLGIYGRSQALLLFPLANFASVFASVMFPTFTKISAQKEILRSTYLKSTQLIMFVVVPFAIGLFVTARPFVLTVYGNQWAGMIPIVRCLSLVTILQGAETLARPLLLSLSRPGLQFKLDLLTRGMTAVGIIVGLSWGIIGVALGYLFASIFGFLPTLYYATQGIDSNLFEFFRGNVGILLCGIGMGLSVSAITMILPAGLPVYGHLTIQVTSGIFFYLLFCHFSRIDAYRSFVHLAGRQCSMILKGRGRLL